MLVLYNFIITITPEIKGDKKDKDIFLNASYKCNYSKKDIKIVYEMLDLFDKNDKLLLLLNNNGNVKFNFSESFGFIYDILYNLEDYEFFFK